MIGETCSSPLVKGQSPAEFVLRAEGKMDRVKMIEDELEITITSLGKPDPHFINYCSDLNYNFDYVIGDRVDTDIFFGNQINAISILVETGVKNYESTDSADIKLKSFSEVVSFIS